MYMTDSFSLFLNKGKICKCLCNGDDNNDINNDDKNAK